MVPQVLRKLRASEGAAAALGGILLVGSRLAKRLGARNPELGVSHIYCMAASMTLPAY